MDFQGHEIFYIDQPGADPQAAEVPIICLHGFPTSSWDWHLVWDKLAARHRVIALDFLGFGFSSKPDLDYSISLQTDIVQALCDKLGIESVHILSHDFAVTVAQELLARLADPDRESLGIRSVCFLNGGLFPETHRANLTQKMMVSWLGKYFVRLVPDSAHKSNLRKLFGPDTQPDQSMLDQLWFAMSFNSGLKVLPGLLHYIAERIQHRERWVSVLHNSKVPLRVINGVEDAISGGHMARYYAEVIEDSDVVLLENVGHYPQLEVPQVTWQNYSDFLQNQPAPAA